LAVRRGLEVPVLSSSVLAGVVFLLLLSPPPRPLVRRTPPLSELGVPALVGESFPEAEAKVSAVAATSTVVVAAAGEGLSAGEGFVLLALEASSDGVEGFFSAFNSGVAGSATAAPAPAPAWRSGVEGVFLPMPNMPKRRPPEPVVVAVAVLGAATAATGCCCSGVDVVAATGPAAGFATGVASVSTLAALSSSLIASICTPV
jgi:hypothetical protein